MFPHYPGYLTDFHLNGDDIKGIHVSCRFFFFRFQSPKANSAPKCRIRLMWSARSNSSTIAGKRGRQLSFDIIKILARPCTVFRTSFWEDSRRPRRPRRLQLQGALYRRRRICALTALLIQFSALTTESLMSSKVNLISLTLNFKRVLWWGEQEASSGSWTELQLLPDIRVRSKSTGRDCLTTSMRLFPTVGDACSSSK